MDKLKSSKQKHFKSTSLYHVPWSNFNEWKACYDLLYNNKYSSTGEKVNKVEENLDSFIQNLNVKNLMDAMNLMNIWKIRNDSINIILTTSLLTEEIIKIKNGQIYSNSEDLKHVLSQKIIRVTNLIIDDLKKKNRNLNSNMFLVAKQIDFPEFIVEIRHSCTHKNLPDDKTLLFVIKYLFYWIKENIWDKQFDMYRKEIQLTEKTISLLSNIRKLSKKSFDVKISELENIFSSSNGYNLHYELANLFTIIQLFIKSMIDSLELTDVECKAQKRKENKDGASKSIINKPNGKSFTLAIPICESLNEYSKLYKFLLSVEKSLIPILFFNFISQQVIYFTKDYIKHFDPFILSEKDKELKTLHFIANFVVKADHIKEFSINTNKKEDLKLLKKKIYNILKFSSDFSIYFGQIFNYFLMIFGEDQKEEISLTPNLGKDLNLNNIKSQMKSKFNTDNHGTLLFKQMNMLMTGGKIDMESINQSVDKNVQMEVENVDSSTLQNEALTNQITQSFEEDKEYELFLDNYLRNQINNSMII